VNALDLVPGLPLLGAPGLFGSHTRVFAMSEIPIPMTPDVFYEGFVLMDYEDWKRDHTSIRLAFHVAVSAFHLADHYCRYHQRTNTAFRQRFGKEWLKDDGLDKFVEALINRHPSFKPIHDMATAYKHLYTRSRCSVLSGGAIFKMLRSESVEVNQEDQNGAVVIMIRHKDGSNTIFKTAISRVIEMWKERMKQDDPSVV
jgi:hypothetical protein